MTSTIQSCGGCICGAVKIKALTMSTKASACHCDTCRKWGGGPLMAVECQQSVEFFGEEYISVFDSSEWAERGFCGKCGTHLFYRLKQNQHYHMPIGLFTQESELVFDHQIFIEQKPEYYSFSNKTINMTGEELFNSVSNQK